MGIFGDSRESGWHHQGYKKVRRCFRGHKKVWELMGDRQGQKLCSSVMRGSPRGFEAL